MAWLFFLLATACSTTSVELVQDCDVQLSVLTPNPASPGTEVEASVRPVTTVWDTAVYAGSTRTRVLNVTRDGCSDCDDCRARQGCSACEDCDECDTQCDTQCVETVTFEALSTLGAHSVSIYNGYGQSNSATLEIREPAAVDTGASDSGDTEPADTGAATGADTASTALGDSGAE